MDEEREGLIQPGESMQELIGKSVFGGIAIGRISVYNKDESTVKRVKIEDTAAEVKRFEEAKETAKEQLQALYEKALVEVGEVNAMIFDVHQMMLDDLDYVEAITHMIENQGINAEYAVATTGDNFSNMFAAMDDDYMKARAADVKDISNRVVKILQGKKDSVLDGDEPVILLADDLAPSETVQLDKSKVLAFVTRHGSTNSHTAILARTAGVSCEMDTIMEIAGKYNLKVVEDAAQGVMSKYKGKSLGTIGDYGCYSFHETKNYSMGEGGAILIRDAKDSDRAEIVREKGTDRSRFLRGQVDKYTWVAAGSSYLPSDLNAAYLYAQLEVAQQVFDDRMNSWNKYNEAFKYLKDKGVIETPFVPEECEHNAHMYYIKLDNIEERTKFINYMKENDILTVFHYIPLH